MRLNHQRERKLHWSTNLLYGTPGTANGDFTTNAIVALKRAMTMKQFEEMNETIDFDPLKLEQ
jgi:hypothetical protein